MSKRADLHNQAGQVGLSWFGLVYFVLSLVGIIKHKFSRRLAAKTTWLEMLK
jgi:hypothetical protein